MTGSSPYRVRSVADLTPCESVKAEIDNACEEDC
jgi:hypothetical protein